MKEETQQVDPYSYTYEKDQVISLNAQALLSFMSFLEEVIDNQPKIAALKSWPKQVTEIRDDSKKLLKVDIDWEEHNPDSFFFTAAADNGGVPICTHIDMKAQQLLFALTQIHQDNINKKIAIKVEDRETANAFKA